MSEAMKEQMSALMDGELDHQVDQTVSDLLHNEELLRTWRRYHILSDVLKGYGPAHIGRGLANSISASIKAEPSILAPQGIRPRSYIKPIAGFAIAASVATMAILGIQREQNDQVNSQPSKLVANQAEVISRPQQLPTQSKFVNVAVAPFTTRNAQKNPRLNSYLVNYYEYRTTQTSMQGMLPYVRIISYESDK